MKLQKYQKCSKSNPWTEKSRICTEKCPYCECFYQRDPGR